MGRWLALIVALAVVPTIAMLEATGEDRVSIARNAEIGSNEVVTGNLVVIGADARVDGQVRGDVVVIGGSLAVSGQIQGQTLAFGRQVQVEQGGFLAHDVAVLGGAVTDQGGVIVGRIDQIGAAVEPNGLALDLSLGALDIQGKGWGWVLAVRTAQVGMLISILLVLGLATTLFWPRRLEVIGLTLHEAFVPSAIFGLLTVPVGVALTLLLMATVLGAPLSLILGGALAVVSGIGLVALAQDIGERIWEAYFPRQEPGGLAALGGLLVLGVIALPLFVLAPAAGFLALWLISLPGMGAVLLTHGGQTPPTVAESRAARWIP